MLSSISSTLKRRITPPLLNFNLSKLFNIDNIPKLPPDALFDLQKRFTQDTRSGKVNLGIGAYRDDEGKNWILPSVHKLELAVQQDPNYNHEYLPIAGDSSLTSLLAKLILGDESKLIAEDKVVSVQSLSGTGALHMLSRFIGKFLKDVNGDLPTIYVSGPTWGNHLQIFKQQNLPVVKYPYWNQYLKELDINGMLSLINTAPMGSVFLLHTCAHNPTGMDPTHEQWHMILDAIIAKNHLPIFDSAYQGFNSGSLVTDSWVVRTAGELSIPMLICQSFLKNFGLYGERVGCFHVVVPQNDTALKQSILSQLQKFIRTEFSNPPLYGAKIVSKILNTPDLKLEWEQDLRKMSSRIIKMRHLLRDNLVELQTPGNWDHIIKQEGMFSFTGLTPDETQRLEHLHGVYMASSGRISMAGINESNVKDIAVAINEVVNHYN